MRFSYHLTKCFCWLYSEVFLICQFKCKLFVLLQFYHCMITRPTVYMHVFTEQDCSSASSHTSCSYCIHAQTGYWASGHCHQIQESVWLHVCNSRMVLSNICVTYWQWWLHHRTMVNWAVLLWYGRLWPSAAIPGWAGNSVSGAGISYQFGTWAFRYIALWYRIFDKFEICATSVHDQFGT